MINIEIKYDVGDEISYQIKEPTAFKETCSFCNGVKKVQGHDGTVLNCPKCNGTGQTPVVETRTGKATVRNIGVSYNTTNGEGIKVVYYTTAGEVNQNEIIENQNS